MTRRSFLTQLCATVAAMLAALAPGGSAEAALRRPRSLARIIINRARRRHRHHRARRRKKGKKK